MSTWIAGISRGHNAGVCLLKDGEIVFSIEEERLTRVKYDGAPLAAIMKIKEYTDKLDYLVITHTTRLEQHNFNMDYCGDDPYSGLARKMGLIGNPKGFGEPSEEVIDIAQMHHRTHAALAFYNSGFDEACAVIVDGAGSWTKFGVDEDNLEDYWECETIFDCAYPSKFDTVYKHIGTKFGTPTYFFPKFNSSFWCGYGEHENFESKPDHELLASNDCGIVKTYEAVTEYCGFPAIEAGKTMGLSPYGEEIGYLPPLWKDDGYSDLGYADKNFFSPKYPNGANFSINGTEELFTPEDYSGKYYDLDNRKNTAWRIQNDSQKEVLKLIRKAVKMTGKNNVVISGGYGLNCVANYWYLDQLKDEGINVYVEPVSNDGGTAMGAALFWHYHTTKDSTVREPIKDIYFGFEYSYTTEDIVDTADKYGGIVSEASNQDVIDLIVNKNIVACFQGRSESGPRALGNRSFLYDPRDPDGKDHVNSIKKREFFRPFAGSILKEHVHEWFDLRGMDETPFMMYAVNCQPGIEEKIPAIIHVDGTCRIQTVTEDQNKNYYDLINCFYETTGCPIIFNTSFNLGGEPLVETLDDAIRTLSTSKVEYLYLPEYEKLIKVSND
jgi:carbamoyltransferase